MKVNPAMLLPPLAVGGGLLVPSLTQAWEPNVGYVYFAQRDGETKDKAYNYDYKNRDDHLDPDNVDFPVNLIWWGAGEIDDVKNEFFDDHGWCKHPGYLGGCFSASLNARLSESDNVNGNFVWDGDRGVKSDACYYGGPFAENQKGKAHVRLYAPADPPGEIPEWPREDQFYSLAWVYYIIGTSHFDVNHSSGCSGGGPQRFGWNEEAEYLIEHFVVEHGDEHGWVVSPDYWNMYNYGDHWIDDDHYQTSDGKATFIAFK